MGNRLTCACGCGEKFEPVNNRQMYVSVKHKNRALVRRWKAKHKKNGPPPGKPPGHVRFGRPKLAPTEAALPFESVAESPGSGGGHGRGWHVAYMGEGLSVSQQDRVPVIGHSEYR
jgi:hypothetical protein